MMFTVTVAKDIMPHVDGIHCGPCGQHNTYSHDCEVFDIHLAYKDGDSDNPLRCHECHEAERTGNV